MPHLRSAGELAYHISEGRFDWFQRTFGVSRTESANLIATWQTEDAIIEQSSELVKGLEATWQMVEDALRRWTVADLAQTYPLSYQGENYALPRQWIPLAHYGTQPAPRRRTCHHIRHAKHSNSRTERPWWPHHRTSPGRTFVI
ncbi:MAG: hypothetical protein ACXWOX_15475 [Ktedonobacteraceae bacterium]